MQRLESLTREARNLASQMGSPASGFVDRTRAGIPPVIPLGGNEVEVARQMRICNACRYCEGFCAVFQAMTRRLEFEKADINYLANLCHNCGACYHACQYASPHEFAVNVPRAMAKVRAETYAEYSWPRALGALYRCNALTVALATAAALALFLILAIAMKGSLFPELPDGNFYAIFPHGLMVGMFGVVFGLAILALGIGVIRFWRDVSPGAASMASATEATLNALTLRYLDGGHGDGCNEVDDSFTLARRRFHHFTFYGFMSCFAATTVATFYHYFLNLHAPYAWSSVPVMLGIAGGIGLLIGPAGLLWLNVRRHREAGDPAQRPMDRGFIALLLVTSASGLALLVCRNTAAMPLMLALHLGVVMAFFATMPYGKFAHAVYRAAALLKWSIERRQPNPLMRSEDW